MPCLRKKGGRNERRWQRRECPIGLYLGSNGGESESTWRRKARRSRSREESGVEGATVALHGSRAATALGGELTRTLELERRK
jgi:hypothetical protein